MPATALGPKNQLFTNYEVKILHGCNSSIDIRGSVLLLG